MDKRDNLEVSGGSQKAPCRVKIVRCEGFSQGWYRNLIGEEFETDLAPQGKDYVLWEDYINNHTTWRHIAHDDCVRLNSDPNDAVSDTTKVESSTEADNQNSPSWEQILEKEVKERFPVYPGTQSEIEFIDGANFGHKKTADYYEKEVVEPLKEENKSMRDVLSKIIDELPRRHNDLSERIYNQIKQLPLLAKK